MNEKNEEAKRSERRVWIITNVICTVLIVLFYVFSYKQVPKYFILFPLIAVGYLIYDIFIGKGKENKWNLKLNNMEVFIVFLTIFLFLISRGYFYYIIPTYHRMVFGNIPRLILSAGLTFTFFINYRRTNNNLSKKIAIALGVIFLLLVLHSIQNIFLYKELEKRF